MNNLIIVALGSALGGVSRYLLSDCVRRPFPTAFPLGTLVVNLAGCFVMGLLAGLLAHTRALSEARWLLLAVGFCGSFTTFSTFAADNLRLLSEKSLPLFLLNLGLSVAGGLLAAWLGYRLVLHFSE